MIMDFKGIKPQIHDTSFIAPGVAVIGDVKVGENSSIWFNSVIRGDMAPISIGKNTNVQDGCVLHCAANIKLEIGDNVIIGHGVILHSCSIEDNSLIGMGSIVLDGAKIGKNCLIGAGSVVTPNIVVPDGSLVLGSPAKVKRSLGPDEIASISKNTQSYVNLMEEYKEELEV